MTASSWRAYMNRKWTIVGVIAGCGGLGWAKLRALVVGAYQSQRDDDGMRPMLRVEQVSLMAEEGQVMRSILTPLSTYLVVDDDDRSVYRSLDQEHSNLSVSVWVCVCVESGHRSSTISSMVEWQKLIGMMWWRLHSIESWWDTFKQGNQRKMMDRFLICAPVTAHPTTSYDGRGWWASVAVMESEETDQESGWISCWEEFVSVRIPH